MHVPYMQVCSSGLDSRRGAYPRVITGDHERNRSRNRFKGVQLAHPIHEFPELEPCFCCLVYRPDHVGFSHINIVLCCTPAQLCEALLSDELQAHLLREGVCSNEEGCRQPDCSQTQNHTIQLARRMPHASAPWGDCL